MIDDKNLTPQTVSLVNVRTGDIYRYKEITVAADLNCTLTYSPVNPNLNLQDIQLSFDDLPEVHDVIREMEGNPDLVVAAIVVLGEEQEDEGCPVCEEMGDEESPENFEKHCQMYAERAHNMIVDAIRVGKLDEAIEAVVKLRNELPDEMVKRIGEITREHARKELYRAMVDGSL